MPGRNFPIQARIEVKGQRIPQRYWQNIQPPVTPQLLPLLLPARPPRPQVCAPSNSALDEIVLRLITAGLTDRDGRVFTPNVVSGVVGLLWCPAAT